MPLHSDLFHLRAAVGDIGEAIEQRPALVVELSAAAAEIDRVRLRDDFQPVFAGFGGDIVGCFLGTKLLAFGARAFQLRFCFSRSKHQIERNGSSRSDKYSADQLGELADVAFKSEVFRRDDDRLDGCNRYRSIVDQRDPHRSLELFFQAMHAHREIQQIGDPGLAGQILQLRLVDVRGYLRLGEFERLEQQKPHAHIAQVVVRVDRFELDINDCVAVFCDAALDGVELVGLENLVLFHGLHVDV